MTPTQTTDAELKDRVQLELKWTAALEKSHIEVAVSDGTVTLSGHVADYSQIGIAEYAASEVAGARSVAQDIAVHSELQPFNDFDIAASLARKFADTAEIPEAAIHVTVTLGSVFLRGVVPWAPQRIAAENAAVSVKGVQRVNNLIEVSSKVAAQEIARRIEAVLERDAHDELHHISVLPDARGNVVLEGTARSVADINEIGLAARGVPGVETVENLMHVAY